MSTVLLSELRDRLELILSINAGDSYVDSTPELQDIQEAYKASCSAYDWPQLLVRRGIVKVANLDRYALPSDFRKARTVKLDDMVLTEVEKEFLNRTRRGYVIDQQQDDIIITPIPTAASTAYTLSNAESAGSAVTIELDTVSGLSQFDEIWIDSASGTDEFTMVSAVGTLQITARLDSAKSASDILYRQKDIIDLVYYRQTPTLSASGDTLLLPDVADLVICHYAAYLGYNRLEQYAEADKQLETWEKQLARAWLADGKNSTGTVTSFGARF